MTKKTLAAAAAALFLLPLIAGANGLSLNGLGTRAQGMGGAFVSIADDFSAVFWNPAGAAGFRKETFGFAATDLIPRTTYEFASMFPVEPQIHAKTKISHYLGFLGGYYRPIGDSVVVGIGIGTPTAQGIMWNGADLVGLSGGVSYDWSDRIYVFSFSPMVAVRLGEAVSLGAALNIDYGSSSFKTPAGIASVPGSEVPVDLGQYEETMNGWGVGATFGALVRPIDRLSLGLTVRTPSSVAFDGTASMSNLILYELPGSSAAERKITWPLAIAGGVSFRPVERLLLSADVQWTQWSKLSEIRTTFIEAAWAPLVEEVSQDVRVLDWKDATQVRFGAEYALSASTALRAGYYHDPAPGPDSTLDLLQPTFTGNAFTIGLGETFGALKLDLGLEYLSGVTRRTGLDWQLESGAPGIYTWHAFVPSVSVQYQF